MVKPLATDIEPAVYQIPQAEYEHFRECELQLEKQKREIAALQEAVRRYCDPSRMATVEPMSVQQAIDRAIEAAPKGPAMTNVTYIIVTKPGCVPECKRPKAGRAKDVVAMLSELEEARPDGTVLTVLNLPVGTEFNVWAGKEYQSIFRNLS